MNTPKVVLRLVAIAGTIWTGEQAFGQALVDVGAFDAFRYSEVAFIPQGDKTRLIDASGCYLETLNTREGRVISNNGWGVTSEVHIANYTLVSFNGNIAIGTSGACFKSEGNIAVFRDDDLLGLIYTEDPADTSIGRLSLQEGGIVRLHAGDPTDLPLLDIMFDRHQLLLTEVDVVTSYCGGRYLVPNVYGQDINIARQTVLQAGWEPNVSIQDVEDSDFIAAQMREAGVEEVVGCSGTGMGYCSYRYSQNNASLLVSSIEPARVNSLRVDCDN